MGNVNFSLDPNILNELRNSGLDLIFYPANKNQPRDATIFNLAKNIFGKEFSEVEIKRLEEALFPQIKKLEYFNKVQASIDKIARFDEDCRSQVCRNLEIIADEISVSHFLENLKSKVKIAEDQAIAKLQEHPSVVALIDQRTKALRDDRKEELIIKKIYELLLLKSDHLNITELTNQINELDECLETKRTSIILTNKSVSVDIYLDIQLLNVVANKFPHSAFSKAIEPLSNICDKIDPKAFIIKLDPKREASLFALGKLNFLSPTEIDHLYTPLIKNLPSYEAVEVLTSWANQTDDSTNDSFFADFFSKDLDTSFNFYLAIFNTLKMKKRMGEGDKLNDRIINYLDSSINTLTNDAKNLVKFIFLRLEISDPNEPATIELKQELLNTLNNLELTEKIEFLDYFFMGGLGEVTILKSLMKNYGFTLKELFDSENTNPDVYLYLLGMIHKDDPMFSSFQQQIEEDYNIAKQHSKGLLSSRLDDLEIQSPITFAKTFKNLSDKNMSIKELLQQQPLQSDSLYYNHSPFHWICRQAMYCERENNNFWGELKKAKFKNLLDSLTETDYSAYLELVKENPQAYPTSAKLTQRVYNGIQISESLTSILKKPIKPPMTDEEILEFLNEE